MVDPRHVDHAHELSRSSANHVCDAVDVPRFDRPEFTVDADVYCVENAITIPAAVPAWPVGRIAESAVEHAADEPMVRVEHRRIRCLANYWHAGWRAAIPGTWLRAGAADRLDALADSLPPPWGLAVFDAWRPLELQIELYETAVADPDVVDGFMATPSTDPMRPPPHLSGGAVDLTLTHDGTPLALGTGFDDTTEAAFVDHLRGLDTPSARLRAWLLHLMNAAGFVVYPGEWWHFEHGTMRWAATTGEPARYAATAPPAST